MRRGLVGAASRPGLGRDGCARKKSLMYRTLPLVLVGAALSAVALAGCSSGGGTSYSSPSGAASSGVLGVSTTSLGEIVVNGTGFTAYMFDKDTQGATSSACAGDCAAAWPAIEADTATPSVSGVTGTVGTITGVDGKLQVTLDGWPLYTYAKDAAAGEVSGQGVEGIWWVVTPGGERVTAGGVEGV